MAQQASLSRRGGISQRRASFATSRPGDFNVPTGIWTPNIRRVIQGEIGIGQGEGGQGKYPSIFSDFIGPRNYIREGDELNPAYQEKYQELSNLRGNFQPASIQSIVRDLASLTPGLKLRANLKGITIGELVHAIRAQYGAHFLRGLFLYGTVRDVHITASHSESHPTARTNRYIRDLRVKHVPLWKVVPLYPVSNGGNRFQGGTLNEHTGGMMNLFVENLIAMAHGREETEGSDISSFFMINEVSILRRNAYPVLMDQRISPIRTGGFAELLPKSSSFKITVEELLDEYGDVLLEKGRPHCFVAGKVEQLQEWLFYLVFDEKKIREDALLELGVTDVENDKTIVAERELLRALDKQEITIFIPGGTGCCVDNCIEQLVTYYNNEYIKKNLCPPSPLVNFNMMTLKQSAIQSYVNEKLEQNRKKRNRNGNGFTREVIESLHQKFSKDYLRRTRHGYSSFYFKYLKKEARRLYRLNPRIFYERYEWKGDERPLPCALQPRTLELCQSQLSTSSRDDVKPTSYISGRDQFFSLSMFRININGEIYRHYPKSYYIEETNTEMDHTKMPFVSDNEEGVSGLLHAIGVFPYFPYELLKHKNILGAFYRVIEKRTKRYMDIVRGKSLGDSNVSEVNLSEMVRYQLQRHRDGDTKTLIYTSDLCEDTPLTPPLHPQAVPNTTFEDRPVVIAYDIESVELTPECAVSGLVPGIFLHKNPDQTKFEQIERQVPYMVQWVPVNLADEGALLAKKMERGISPRTETESVNFHSRNDWIYGKGEPDDPTTKQYRKGWIVLDEAKIEYGNNFLGVCVENFIYNVYLWAIEHKYTSAKCYAHNGAQFDSFLIQAFNTRFKVVKILQVKGSILSMRIKVPISRPRPPHLDPKAKHFFIDFSDSRKFVSGSLASLCRDFRLPDVWSKLEFPIARINWRNCYHPEIKALVEPYGLNDAYALAFILKQINRMLCLHPSEIYRPEDEVPLLNTIRAAQCTSQFNPLLLEARLFSDEFQKIDVINLNTKKPPITQFCTNMSFIKRVLNSYVLSLPATIRPKTHAIDIPCLRHWVDMALMGGRVSSYAKVYVSSLFGDILEAWMKNDKNKSREYIRKAIALQDTFICLDETSLYPAAMALCPLPLGELKEMTKAEAFQSIVQLYCMDCEEQMTFCEKHRLPDCLTFLPFSIVLVKNFNPTPEAKRNPNLMNLVARKIRPARYKSAGGKNVRSTSFTKSDGLCYSLETDQEATLRLWGERNAHEIDSDWNVFGAVQAYTNIDLYWAKKAGFTFDVVGGFSWQTSGALSRLYRGLYGLRAKAKMEKNHSLQLSLKTILNGGYGVHCQKLINSLDKVVEMSPDFYDADIKDSRVTKFIRDGYHATFNSRFVLKENVPLATKQSFVRAKIPNDLGECVGGHSPNHIGAAIVAWSRHILNLVAFPLCSRRPCAISYTDTDSLCIPQALYDDLCANSSIIDESGKKLGTLKNDHSDIFPGARILFSSLGGKKVKMHIIGCPDTGELKICNTFKGFICDDSDGEGRKYDRDRADYLTSKALIDILYNGCPEGHTGTRWNRDLHHGGVQIEKNVEFTPSSDSYIGQCKSYVILSGGDGREALVGCVPHGSTALFHPDKVFTPYIEPNTGAPLMDSNWRSALDSILDGDSRKRRVTREFLMKFLAKYFNKKDAFYGALSQTSNSPETEWQIATRVIDGVNDEILMENLGDRIDSLSSSSSSSSSVSLSVDESDFGIMVNDLDLNLERVEQTEFLDSSSPSFSQARTLEHVSDEDELLEIVSAELEKHKYDSSVGPLTQSFERRSPERPLATPFSLPAPSSEKNSPESFRKKASELEDLSLPEFLAAFGELRDLDISHDEMWEAFE